MEPTHALLWLPEWAWTADGASWSLLTVEGLEANDFRSLGRCHLPVNADTLPLAQFAANRLGYPVTLKAGTWEIKSVDQAQPEWMAVPLYRVYPDGGIARPVRSAEFAKAVA